MTVLRDQELYSGIGQVVRFGLRRNAGVGAFDLALNVAELLIEVQLAEEKREWSAHIVALLKLHSFDPIFVRRVQPEQLAVGNKQLTRRLRVRPSHFARFAKHEDAALGAARLSRRRILFREKDLQRPGPVVPAFHALEEAVGLSVRVQRAHRHQPDQQP